MHILKAWFINLTNRAILAFFLTGLASVLLTGFLYFIANGYSDYVQTKLTDPTLFNILYTPVKSNISSILPYLYIIDSIWFIGMLIIVLGWFAYNRV